jgi:hypothetical protein
VYAQAHGHDLWQALRSRDDVPASSLRVPDARRGARLPLGVAGSSTATRSTARSRPRSASSRRWSTCEFPPRPRRKARRAIAPRRRRNLDDNKIDGPVPPEIGQLTALTRLRVPPASPTPGAARDRPWRRRALDRNQITGTFPRALCDVQTCVANSGNSLVAPCGTTGCCDLENGAAWDVAACLTVEELLARAERAEARADSSRCDGKGGSIAIIIPVVIAAVLLVAAVLYLVRKRRVAALQPHRQSSMPTIGGEDEVQAEA